MKILVINGPNINMLGIREPQIYGRETYRDLVNIVQKHADANGIDVEFFQSNCEGEIINQIQSAYNSKDAIIINPAAYTHTSIAILDALKAVGIPVVEVHISDISKREVYRQFSYVSEYATATICGKGIAGYVEAMEILISKNLNY